MKKNKRKTFPILLVEDYSPDIVAVKRIWEKNNVEHPLYVVRNGEQCLQFLLGRGEYENETPIRPGLLIIDLKMPRMGGLELLKKIRSRPDFKNLPVVIFSTSSSDEEVLKCYESGANSYLAKPADFDTFQDALLTVIAYWGHMRRT